MQLEHNIHEPLGKLNICQSILKSFKTLRTLTVRMSGQTSLTHLRHSGHWSSGTPATHWASVTLVTVLCKLNICQSILKSFKTLQTLTVRMSGQMSLTHLRHSGHWSSGTPATHWASVTLVTVQTMSIQSTDLGRLGQMLLSTGQTEPDIALMSLVLHGEIVTHMVKLFPSDTLTKVNTLQLR